MKIVLAYSGGLDTSVILAWLKETYDAQLITFCANLGQEEELDGLEAKAKKTGASRCYIVDLEEEFARDFIFPLFQAGAILHFAHRQMETLTMDREVMHLRDSLIPRYAELVYYGYWFAPERLALQAYVTESQKNVTGTVRVKLYKGNIMCAGRKSPVSLYNPAIATMEADPTKAYNQDDATGFIRLNALRLKVAARVQRKK